MHRLGRLVLSIASHLKVRRTDRAHLRVSARLLTAAILAAPLVGCGSLGTTNFASISNAFSGPLGEPRHLEIFVASTRRGEHGAANELTLNGTHYSLQMISIPPNHKVGEIERPLWGKPDPQHDFMVVWRHKLTEKQFRNGIATHISGRIGSNRDVLVYVHGFNTSYNAARFRLAQIVEDGHFGGVPVLFTWPSSNNLLGYEAARDTAAASRDALAEVLLDVSHLPDIGRVQILAHSLGTWLTMEALDQRALAGDASLNGKLGDVILAAPDIDLSVFREELAPLAPSHISVLVSDKDKALALSSWLNGDRPRVGALNPHNPADRAALERLGIKVYNLSPDSTGLIGHGTYADAPAVVQALGREIGKARFQDEEVQAVLGKNPIDHNVTSAPLPAVSATAGGAARAPMTPAPASRLTTPVQQQAGTTGSAPMTSAAPAASPAQTQ